MKKRFSILLCCIFLIIFLIYLGSLQTGGIDSKERVDFFRKGLLIAGSEFHESFGFYPKGDANEILRQLGGENRLNRKFIDLNERFFKVNGQYVIILDRRLRLNSDGRTFEVSLVEE